MAQQLVSDGGSSAGVVGGGGGGRGKGFLKEIEIKLQMEC